MTAWTFALRAAPVVDTARDTRTCDGASTSYRRAASIRGRGQRSGAHGRLPAISRDEFDAVLDDDDERIALEQTRRTFLASFALLTTASSSGIALASPSIPRKAVATRALRIARRSVTIRLGPSHRARSHRRRDPPTDDPRRRHVRRPVQHRRHAVPRRRRHRLTVPHHGRSMHQLLGMPQR